MNALAIDLFCGLGGWTDGLIAEGYNVIGFDIERHDYGTGGYPAQLVLQDVLTLHGKQFKDAALIVASPPCQGYSYRAMPWSRAKALPPPDNSLFEACFRIQREAIEAAGHFIPLVVENVRGAQKWVGRSRWNYGSYHLWGDVPALMPMTRKAARVPGLNWNGSDKPGYVAKAFNTTAEQRLREMEGWAAGWAPNSELGQKTVGHINKRDGHGHTRHLTNQRESDALKGANGGWFNDNKRDGKDSESGYLSRSGSKSKARKARKAASAAIAKIPFPLAQHIARYWAPRQVAA